MFQATLTRGERATVNSSPRVGNSRATNFRQFAGITILLAVVCSAGCGVRRSDLGEIVTEFPDGPAAKATGTQEPSTASPAEEGGAARSPSGNDDKRPADEAPAADVPK
ncbi:MAG TPA: hypothetical protein VHD36_05505 [Pirellulales bacterium]|nr:hypothetical protein [Pirellulales bacterium]